MIEIFTRDFCNMNAWYASDEWDGGDECIHEQLFAQMMGWA